MPWQTRRSVMQTTKVSTLRSHSKHLFEQQVNVYWGIARILIIPAADYVPVLRQTIGDEPVAKGLLHDRAWAASRAGN